ncbi:response regulator [Telluribacter sp. SYSU D00476]|uniref:response regulator n=1 Tax=Telluribacter sp. SYSU D00476 TaxID=2811430 RepID=UPI001FF6017B|nr:response regulator [Telluribacter sp. SYSU D00476]
MIYVVDDAADYRFLVDQVFKRFLPHYPHRLFADGMELIQAIEINGKRLEKPKVILLDMDMPKLNGLQTLERLRQLPEWRTIPVIIVSNRLDEAFVRASYQMGANSFLPKPLDFEQLKSVMSLIGQYWMEINQIPCTSME